MSYLHRLIFLLFFFCACIIHAQDFPEPMSPPRLVNDFAGVYTPQERAELEKMLLNYNDTTSTQIYVVTVDDLQGYDVSDYSFRLGEKWGIGQKGKNNGALILIKPKRGNSRGSVYIAVGYGLEPYLNDARIGRILDNYMIPYLREDNYYMGTVETANIMMEYLSGQFQADPRSEGLSASDIIIGTILIILFIYFMNKINRNNNNGNRNKGRSRGPVFFPPMSGGGFGGFGRGGGFGGGGGGSFGGGGAGRSW